MKQIKDTKSIFPCKQNIILVLEPGKSLPIRFRRNTLQSDLSEIVLPIQFPLVATNSRELEQLLNVLHFLIQCIYSTVWDRDEELLVCQQLGLL